MKTRLPPKQSSTVNVQRKVQDRSPQTAPPQIRGSDPAAAMDRAERFGHHFGRPLAGPVRGAMEGLFGADFTGVRVHESQEPLALNADAFTRGDEIHFAPGRYQPHDEGGRELLGHELAHVLHQRKASRPGAQGRGAAVNASPSLEAEAESAGARIAAGQPVAVTGAAAGHAGVQPGKSGKKGLTKARAKERDNKDFKGGKGKFAGRQFSKRVKVPSGEEDQGAVAPVLPLINYPYDDNAPPGVDEEGE